MNTQLAQLRSLIAARFPTAVQTDFSRASSMDNDSIELVPGALVEIVAPELAAGAGLLLLHLCSQAKGPLALVDANDSLDLPALSSELRNRLLWLRGHGVKDSLKAADMLLRDGNLTTVLLDLRQVPSTQLLGLPSSIWHRLRMLAERAHAAVMIFTPCQTVGCAAMRWSVSGDFNLGSNREERRNLISRLHPVCQRGFGMATAVDGHGLSLQS